MKAKLQQLFVSSRPISWVNTAYPFAAAYYITTGLVDWKLLIGTFYFLIPYNVLMYGINDVFDYESDILNPRKGGIEGAKLKKESHRFVVTTAVAVNIPFIALFLTQDNLMTKLFLVYLIFMVVAYSAPKLRFKEKPFLDSFTSSTHFVGPMVYGLLIAGWNENYWPFAIAFFLWGMASHAFGAVQDIIPDKEAGIGSIATVIGGARTVRLSMLAYAASFVILFLQGTLPAIAGACNILYLVSIGPYDSIQDKNSESANAGWKRFMTLNWITGAVITMILIYQKTN